MNIDIPADAKVSDILKAVQGLGEGGHIYCGSERHFSLLKICLIKLQKTDVNIYLLDEHGFTLKQVSARKKISADAQNTEKLITAPVIGAELSPPEPQEQAAETVPESTAYSQASVLESAPIASPGSLAPVVDSNVLPKLASAPAPAIVKPIEQGLSHPQISAVRDLEQALRRCKELGLLLIGFSDGLVAVPEALGYGADAISSADALEVESFDAYRGYEADEDTGY